MSTEQEQQVAPNTDKQDAATKPAEQKKTDLKVIIAHLAATFPACFSLEGPAKPLKIGIFQDLSERLADDEAVSKTQLRMALRHYTNSWRYLQSVKANVARVDLDGQAGELVGEEHAAHAEQALAESRAKVQAKRKAEAPKKPHAKKKRPAAGKTNQKVTIKKRPVGKPIDINAITEGTAVTVKVGAAPMPAVITKIEKDGIQVQLNSGMQIKVQEEQLRLAVKG